MHDHPHACQWLRKEEAAWSSAHLRRRHPPGSPPNAQKSSYWMEFAHYGYRCYGMKHMPGWPRCCMPLSDRGPGGKPLVTGRSLPCQRKGKAHCLPWMKSEHFQSATWLRREGIGGEDVSPLLLTVDIDLDPASCPCLMALNFSKAVDSCDYNLSLAVLSRLSLPARVVNLLGAQWWWQKRWMSTGPLMCPRMRLESYPVLRELMLKCLHHLCFAMNVNKIKVLTLSMSCVLAV